MIQRCPWLVTQLSVVAGLIFGCSKHDTSHRDVIATAGIFYGGQLQNRAEWPLVLDATRQTQGFRIEFTQPLSKPVEVHWEIVRGVARQKKHTTEPHTADPDVVVPAGSQRFDQVITFTDSDRPGDWRLKVTVDRAPVLDKTIHVVPRPTAAADD